MVIPPSAEFSNVKGCCFFRYKDLAAKNGEVGEVALALYCATVRATLFVCKGYECQEKEGVFMTAFPGPIKALEWAVTLQMALLRSALLHCSMAWWHVQSFSHWPCCKAACWNGKAVLLCCMRIAYKAYVPSCRGSSTPWYLCLQPVENHVVSFQP